MIEKLEPLQGLDHSWLNKINELVDAVNVLQAQVAILEEHAHPTATTKPAENVQDRMIGCATLDIPKSYKNDQLTLATLDYSKKLEKENSDLKDELERTRKSLAFAKSKLNGIHRLYSKTFYTREDWFQVCMEMVDKANTALEQITVLEKRNK